VAIRGKEILRKPSPPLRSAEILWREIQSYPAPWKAITQRPLLKTICLPISRIQIPGKTGSHSEPRLRKLLTNLSARNHESNMESPQV
jgi:hypothetical protein